MEYTITATALARSLGDVLAKVRYRRDSFVVERNGAQVARLVPVGVLTATLADALRAWRETGRADDRFADDLARIGAQDRVPASPWASS